MKKRLVIWGCSLVFVLGTGSPSLAQPPTEPPSEGAFHACVYRGAPGTIGFPRAPFCPV
jgi:hypothetical protein